MPHHAAIARLILDGFDKHYRLFRTLSAAAKQRFERGAWDEGGEAAKERIKMYDRRVVEATQAVMARYPQTETDESLWRDVKLAYIGLLYEHRQPECAETFYNSVACRVLHRKYFHNEFIFWRPAISTEYLEGSEPAYRCHYPGQDGLRRTLLEILTGFGLKRPWEDLRRDVRYLLTALKEHFPGRWRMQPNFQFQVLASLFYRNKAAYAVGRIINGGQEQPFVIPILQDDRGRLYVDTLLLSEDDIAVVFSFARAYFMVDMEVPSAYVAFIKAILPQKPVAEIYAMLGLQKQGKTIFYRDLHHHLQHSSDNFVVAPGIRGMVMLVFTLPSYPYVFKLIRDRFDPPKETTRAEVEQKYLLVKYHDRVGRLADTLEYSDVALPLERFDPALLKELRESAAGSIEIEGDEIVIRHMYIERRMVPLNLYVEQADEARIHHAVREYGQAIKDMAGANIFPGDMLLKNFGVTRHDRVVFYDYDEITYLTDCNFRRIPPPSSWEDEMAAEPYYSVGHDDVFPEQFPQFLFSDPEIRALFHSYHPELADPAYWAAQQRRIAEGIQEDVFPYPERLRFRRRYAAESLPLARAALSAAG
jgi:isocitrate dehydrogenase kinase/phosphatase